jgi:RNA polymerase primary sigma factor
MLQTHAEYSTHDEGPDLNDPETNALSLYLSQIRDDGELLTESREKLLGRRIKAGQARLIEYAAHPPEENECLLELQTEVQAFLDKSRRPNLSEIEVMALIRAQTEEAAAAEPRNAALARLARRAARVERLVRKAMDELVTANLRLVIMLAKNHAGRGAPLADLIQEGNLGLMKAAGRFDHQRGFRFSTYAAWWVKQSMMRYIYDNGRTVRLPVHLIETRNRFYKTHVSLMKDLGREPTAAETAEAMQVSPRKVEQLILQLKDPLQLDDPLYQEEPSLQPEWSEEDHPSFERINRGQVHKRLRIALARLPQREAMVLKDRYGLGAGEVKTLDQIGSVHCISRERVRQLEKQALKRLRNTDILEF